MKITGVNKYKCVQGELVQIRFFCNPSRQNVNIRQSFDGKSFVTITTNSIQFVMGTAKVVLTLQYAYIFAGTCLNQVLLVENSPTGDDRVASSGGDGDTDLKTFTFNV
jgi:hypothetical protein